MLHLRALAEVVGASLIDFLELLNMLVGRLLEGERLAPLGRVLEIAVVTQSSIVLR